MQEQKIQVRVMGISYTQLKTGAYALLLAQVDGPYRVPIIIGDQEAQAIALVLEGIVPARPITHDLFVSFAKAFDIRITEVYIYKFDNGIFYSRLHFDDGLRHVTVDSRTSDAIAIAIRTNAPIYISRQIIDETGFIIDSDSQLIRPGAEADTDESHSDEPRQDEPPGTSSAYSRYTTDERYRKLEALTECEDYEGAAMVKAEIDRRKGDPHTDDDINAANAY